MIVTTRIRHTRRRPALTLMEVMVVAAILVILAGVGAISVFAYLSDAKEKAAKIGVQTIEDAASDYYMNFSKYPDNLEYLVEPQDGKPAKLDPKALTDPWNNPYQADFTNLNPNTRKPKIWSNGEPGQNRQISNW